MRNSPSMAVRITTIFSLLVLCTLSFTVVYGSDSLDTPPSADTPHLFHRRDAVHHRRAAFHARAIDPSAPVPSFAQPTQGASPPAAASATQSVSSAAQSPSQAPASSAASSSSAAISSSSTQEKTVASSSSDSSQASSTQASSSESSSAPTPTPTSASTSSQLASSSSSTPSTSSRSVPKTISTSPTTASFIHPDAQSTNTGFLVTGTESSSTVFASQTGVSGASSGFFQNKSAVAGTFATLGILGSIAVVFGTMTFMKRRNARRQREEDAFFEKYTGTGHEDAPELGQGALGASATDLHATPAATADAYPDRAVHYGVDSYAAQSAVQVGNVFAPIDYGLEYPPGTVFADQGQGAPSGEYDPYSAYVEPERAVSPNHPFADPANTGRGYGGAPPVAYARGMPGRADGPVVDSFYSGPGQAGVGAGRAH